MKKQNNDSDDESAASSDTDSFVHVEMGSTGTNSDSEWERVGSNPSSENEGDSEEDEEDEEDDFDEVDFEPDLKITKVVSTAFTTPTPTTTTTTTTTTSNNNNNNNNNNNDLTMSKFVNINVSEDDLTEDEMLAHALSLSLQESTPKNTNTNNNTTINTTPAAKKDTLAARFEQMKLTPDHPVDAIGLAGNDVTLLKTHGVQTVGQFAKLGNTNKDVFKTGGIVNETLFEAWNCAMKLVDNLAQKSPSSASASAPASAPPPPPAVAASATPAPPAQEPAGTVFGYHYLSESVYEQIKEDRTVKSAYVLFHEYMECPVALRNLHPWKRVYHAYLADAAKWNGAKGKHKVENLTDTDVYAFLVWRSAESFAKFDVTAGPRAIYFSWTQMPMDTWSNALEIDKIMGEDLRNPTICDRYARVIRINLSKLCEQHRGVLHRVQLKDGVMDSNHWLPTTLPEATQIQSTNLWSMFEPGSSFFSCVPHGCIVMPNGTIPWECIDILEALNSTNRD